MPIVEADFVEGGHSASGDEDRIHDRHEFRQRDRHSLFLVRRQIDGDRLRPEPRCRASKTRLPDGRFRIVNSPFSSVITTASPPTSSTLLPCAGRAAFEKTRPDTDATPLLAVESAVESNIVRDLNSTGLSPSAMGIFAADGCPAPRLEAGLH